MGLSPLSLYTLVFLSAVAHASWNALVKNAGDRLLMMGAIRAVGLTYGLVMLPFVPWPSAVTVGWLTCATVAVFAYYGLLIQSYRIGDMSLVYPIARGCPNPVGADRIPYHRRTPELPPDRGSHLDVRRYLDARGRQRRRSDRHRAGDCDRYFNRSLLIFRGARRPSQRRRSGLPGLARDFDRYRDCFFHRDTARLRDRGIYPGALSHGPPRRRLVGGRLPGVSRRRPDPAAGAGLGVAREQRHFRHGDRRDRAKGRVCCAPDCRRHHGDLWCRGACSGGQPMITRQSYSPLAVRFSTDNALTRTFHPDPASAQATSTAALRRPPCPVIAFTYFPESGNSYK